MDVFHPGSRREQLDKEQGLVLRTAADGVAADSRKHHALNRGALAAECSEDVQRLDKADRSKNGSPNLSQLSREGKRVIIAEQVYREAIVRMDRLFAKIERQRHVSVPEIIRAFLVETAIESLYLRQDDWRRLHNADPGVEGDAQCISEQIEKSLLRLLNNVEAEPSMLDGVPQFTYIGLLHCIQDNWCQIFPFCERRNPAPPLLA